MVTLPSPAKLKAGKRAWARDKIRSKKEELRVLFEFLEMPVTDVA